LAGEAVWPAGEPGRAPWVGVMACPGMARVERRSPPQSVAWASDTISEYDAMTAA